MGAGLLHLLTTSGGAILGGVMRFLADNARDRKETAMMSHNFMMAQAKFTDKSAKAARADASKPVSTTRRYAVVLVLTAVVTMMFIGGFQDAPVYVPIESDGFSLFGLVFGGGVSYEKLSGFVLIPEVLLWGNAMVSMLFGSNIVKR